MITKDRRRTKRDYEIKVARHPGFNPKGFFYLNRTKNKGKNRPINFDEDVFIDTEEKVS